MKNIIIVLIVLVGISVAGTRVYDIGPYGNCNSWTPPYPYNWVGQTFTAICDSFVWTEFFIGMPNDSSGGKHYDIVIQEAPNGPVIASGQANAGISYDYTKANLIQQQGVRIVKGQTYLLKITHSDGDSINFYYDSTNSYNYGDVVVGGNSMLNCDLAARIEGVNKVDDDMFGTAMFYLPMQHVWNFDSDWDHWADVAESAGVKWTREAN